MARDYARIMTAIWDNKEFCNLSEPAQRAYLLLVTQPDISAAGVLSLRVRRWAGMSRTSEPETLSRALKELESGRFIVADWTTEELLIRSFIRWDAGFNNPKRRPVIVRAGNEVRSERIGECLKVEFKRCGLLPDPPPTPNGGLSDREADALRDSLSSPARVDLDNEPFPQVDSLSDSYALDDGVVVTYLSREVPQPALPVPPTAAAATSTADEIRTAQEITKAYHEREPMCRFPAVLGIVRKALQAGHGPSLVQAALLRLADEGRSVTVETLRIEIAGRPPLRSVPSGPPPLPTDSEQALADLRARGAAREAARLIHAPWSDLAQPPGDPTPPGEWLRAQHVAWIDEHADEIRAALTHRQAG